MNQRRAMLAAAAGSFLVYLIPLVGPHALFLLGESLWFPQMRHTPGWVVVNVAIALAMQLVAAGLLYWFARRPSWTRGVALAVCGLAILVAAEWIYLIAVPTRFLEEKDTASEQSVWPEECAVPGEFLAPFRSSTNLWVQSSAEPNRYSVVALPGCTLSPVALPKPTFTPGRGVDFMIDITSAGPGQQAIVRRSQGAKQTWWLTNGAGGLLPLEAPPGPDDVAAPVLSHDGQSVAWLRVIAGSGPPVLSRIYIRPVTGIGRERMVDLSALGPASYVLEAFDTSTQQIDLWQTDHLLRIDFDGKVQKAFPRLERTRPLSNTFLTVADGWLSWDGYRDNDPYLLEWSTASGSGSARVPLGRGIQSAAIDPAGKFVAASVSTGLNIGDAQDSVFVLRTSDGREVFRKYLPRYTRSAVAFPPGGYFAYSDEKGLRVLRIPQ